MPQTINGIGTNYVGKKNVDVRDGTCQACGRYGSLQSYDTRLWFVVVFIPVIPLGRKRIVDQCPYCRRHWIVEQGDWERSKQSGISEAIREYEAQPSPEVALRFHSHLLAYRMHQEAEKFREEVLAQFPDSAELHAGLAAQLETMGRSDQARQHYESALRLNPQLPEARIGVSYWRIAEGRIEEARELLRFLEQPGASRHYSLWPLHRLAHAYQTVGQHETVLEIARHLYQEVPALAESREFRKLVTTSEKAVAVRDGILPRRRFSLLSFLNPKNPRYSAGARWLAVGTLGVCAVVAALIWGSTHLRSNRPLRIVNQLGAPVQVTIDNAAPIRVMFEEEVKIPEGKHHIKISGAVTEEMEVEISSNSFQRLFSRPVWILNPGGAASFYHQKIFYAENPTSEPETTWILGQRFIHYPHVDYAFEDPPNTVELPTHNSVVTKTYLGYAEYTSDQLFYIALSAGPVEEALRFAEARLLRWPPEQQLLSAYFHTALAEQQEDRALAFLRTHLWRGPLSTEWHRTYSQLLPDRDARQALIAEYDARLTQKADDAQLLYLRGFASDRGLEAEEFFEKARAADATYAWTYLSLGRLHADRGDWDVALELAKEGVKLGLPEPELHELHYMARLGVGKLDELLNQYRSVLNRAAKWELITDTMRLCEVYVAKDDLEAATTSFYSFINRLPPNERDVTSMRYYQAYFMYMTKQFDFFVGARGDQPDIALQGVLLTKGPAAAITDPLLRNVLTNGWNSLSVAVAFHLEGDSNSANDWLAQVPPRLAEETDQWHLVIDALQSGEPPTTSEIDNIKLEGSWKALLLCGLAIKHPEKEREFCDLARRLNVLRKPPYYLVQRMTEKVLGP